MTTSTSYTISASHADDLKGIVLLPSDMRRLAMQKLAEKHGASTLVDLFAEFMGLANAVVHNQREAIEIFAIVEGGCHPHTAEQYNLPTIFGALQGVELAAKAPDQSKMCHGCAYRLGSLANQSPITTSDAIYARDEDDRLRFLCHDVDLGKEPSKTCRGWAQHGRSPAHIEPEP